MIEGHAIAVAYIDKSGFTRFSGRNYSTVSHGLGRKRELYEHRLGIQMAYGSVSLFHSRARTGPLDASYGFWLGGHGSKALGSLTVIRTMERFDSAEGVPSTQP